MNNFGNYGASRHPLQQHSLFFLIMLSLPPHLHLSSLLRSLLKSLGYRALLRYAPYELSEKSHSQFNILPHHPKRLHLMANCFNIGFVAHDIDCSCGSAPTHHVKSVLRIRRKSRGAFQAIRRTIGIRTEQRSN